MWLDRGELDKILERSAQQPQHAVAPPQHQQPQYRQKRKESWLSELFD